MPSPAFFFQDPPKILPFPSASTCVPRAIRTSTMPLPIIKAVNDPSAVEEDIRQIDGWREPK